MRLGVRLAAHRVIRSGSACWVARRASTLARWAHGPVIWVKRRCGGSACPQVDCNVSLSQTDGSFHARLRWQALRIFPNTLNMEPQALSVFRNW